MSDHIVKSYDEDLAALKMLLAQMGGLAEQQLDDAIDALSRRDTTLADRVIQNDERIDMLERQIEEKAILTIAKRQPMARDLREIMVAIRVASDLERIGDLAKNTAKRAHAISEPLPRKLMTGVTRMGRLAQSELKDILDAYARSDAEKALEVWRSDEELDSLYNSIFRELLTYMMEDPRNISLCTHLSSAPRTWSASATTPPTSPRTSITRSMAGPWPRTARSAIQPAPCPCKTPTQTIDPMSASILVVEDEEPIQILLSYNLESEGYRARHTAQGEDVPRLVSEERPDLILLDWMLPGVSGIEVCRMLRTKPETRDIPIIMLTARSEEAERSAALPPAPTTTWSSPSRCRNCWPASAPSCAGSIPMRLPTRSRPATSRSTAARGG